MRRTALPQDSGTTASESKSWTDRGIVVNVLATGIEYTHDGFGGPGTTEVIIPFPFAQNVVSPDCFWSEKVSTQPCQRHIAGSGKGPSCSPCDTTTKSRVMTYLTALL
jgi:subtilisin family serine protease